MALPCEGAWGCMWAGTIDSASIMRCGLGSPAWEAHPEDDAIHNALDGAHEPIGEQALLRHVLAVVFGEVVSEDANQEKDQAIEDLQGHHAPNSSAHEESEDTVPTDIMRVFNLLWNLLILWH